jgi:hypothetical protein
MMRLKAKQLGDGLHPSETFVSVETKAGPAVETKTSGGLLREILAT